MSRKKGEPPAAPENVTPALAPADSYAGHGGSYVVDPATGARRLVERTQDRGAAAAPAKPEE